jgi:4-amino-4-deoxy-L-arabinose transferase-like glycosyltransferase
MPSSIAIPHPRGTDLPQAASRRADAVAAVAILSLVAWRVVLAFLDRTELSTDEAQYWFWGQKLEFGAYSKPPLIGWILRLATDLMGQTVWTVRLPAALFHGLTATVIYVFARRIAAQPVALLAALSYLTTPAVALGSALMTTDTPMLLAAAVALLAQSRAAEAHATGQGAPWTALVLGISLGLGLLAKHAMLFWLAGALLAALLSPAWRLRRTDLALAVAAMLIVIAPHLFWLQQHGFITFTHVRDISDGQGLSLLQPARFLAEQLLVMGPILAVAIALALFRKDHDGWTLGLAALTAAPLMIVLLQATRGPTLANWAVLSLVPGSILAAHWLHRHPWLARASLAIGLAVSLAIPAFKVFGTDLSRSEGRPYLARYLGQAELATWALDNAATAGVTTLVARDRDLLAALSWHVSDRGIAIRAVPPEGAPRHHWELTAPYDPATDPGPVLLFLRETGARPCPQAPEVKRFTAGPGFAGNETFILLRPDDPSCLVKEGTTE